jgi:TetR/AcrR family fatty acid metabolism transcriptional regulator
MERAKKECILVEAARAFTRHGFKKASVDVIAKGAGVAKGTVYLACESKEDLFYQVLLREVRAWVAEVAKVIDPRVPADQLLVMASDAANLYLEDRPLLRSLLFGETHHLLPNWTERLDELATLGLDNIVQILKLGIKQGHFREDLDVETTAQILQDMQVSYYILHDHDRGADRDERLTRRAQAAFDLVLHGLTAR